MNKYDDSKAGGYTYEEKLDMVSRDLMAPEEIGLASAEEAQALVNKDKPIKLDDFVTFEASRVPLDVLASWAYQETKIILPESEKITWLEDWKKEHEAEFVIQSRLRCGTALATVQRTVTELVPGFCLMLEDAAKLLKAKYEEQKKKAKIIST